MQNQYPRMLEQSHPPVEAGVQYRGPEVLNRQGDSELISEETSHRQSLEDAQKVAGVDRARNAVADAYQDGATTVQESAPDAKNRMTGGVTVRAADPDSRPKLSDMTVFGKRTLFRHKPPEFIGQSQETPVASNSEGTEFFPAQGSPKLVGRRPLFRRKRAGERGFL